MTDLWAFLLTFLLIPAGLLLRRMFGWWKDQHPKPLLAAEIKASDLISLSSLALTLASLVIGWYAISNQIQRGSLDIQIKNASDQNAALKQELSVKREEEGQEAINDTDIHLESPTGNERVLSTHFPDLRWKYAKHNLATDYLVEIVRVGEIDPSVVSSFKIAEGCVPGDRTCKFHATSPMGQLTAVSTEEIDAAHEGRYLWRVTPVSVGLRGNEQPDAHWSEYGAFCIYAQAPADSSCIEPIVNDVTARTNLRNLIIVGTNYSENVDFSGIRNGERRGYDVDLIRFIVQNCILHKRTFAFDETRCRAASEDKSATWKRLQDDGEAGSLRVAFKSFESVDDGLAALSRGSVDVFIGAMTKAKDRDLYPVKQTMGYFDLQSVLFTRETEKRVAGSADFAEWKNQRTTLGVIDQSTNQRLARKISAMENLEGQVTLESYSSFASLKESFEQRRIGSVLVDSTLEKQLHGVVPVTVPGRIRAAYLQDLGEDQESFTIAVYSSESERSLYDALQVALKSNFVKVIQKRLAIANGVEEKPSKCWWSFCL